MKKILVPTDFSDSALYASDVAVQIAELMHAEVHFYNCVHVPANWAELPEDKRLELPEAYEAFQEMKANFEQLKKRYADRQLRIITAYSHGDFIEVMANYIDHEQIDLVVMGSKGADGMREWLFGSNSQKMVREAHCPILVIKQPLEGINFKHIVFASDFDERALQPFGRLIEFAKPFGAHIHLLNVAAYPKFNISEEDRRRMEVFQRKCWALPCSIHEQGDINIELGIMHFAKDQQADLIALANYGEPLLKRILKGSVSEKLVNHLEMPVLVLNTKELKVWHRLSDSLRESV